VPKSSQSSFTLDVPDECRRRWCATVTVPVPVNLDCDCDCHCNLKFVNSSVQLVVNSACSTGTPVPFSSTNSCSKHINTWGFTHHIRIAFLRRVYSIHAATKAVGLRISNLIPSIQTHQYWDAYLNTHRHWNSHTIASTQYIYWDPYNHVTTGTPPSNLITTENFGLNTSKRIHLFRSHQHWGSFVIRATKRTHYLCRRFFRKVFAVNACFMDV